MPVMVLYKDKKIPLHFGTQLAQEMATLTKTELDAAVEVRIVEPVASLNANELHIEMQFRDFKEWTDDQIANYHTKVMTMAEDFIKKSQLKCAFSFYIVPSQPPRSMWAQIKVGME